MHLHILGICGTFMAGVAQIAIQLGHRVTGSDANVYPPMSTLLASLGVRISNGYGPRNIPETADLCIIGNAMSRGNPEVEHILDQGLAFESGPEWMRRHVLSDRKVIAIAGTHGKTTTTSMVSWILERSGHSCGFLVGGVPGNFDVSARLGDSPWFVVEADEYDTAFFDKRSKFVHYRPHIALLNNLEFDHADIFHDIEQIKTQMHHLVRTVPGKGTVVVNAQDANLADVLERGCWSRVVHFLPAAAPEGEAWRINSHDADYKRFDILAPDNATALIEWSLFGAHNASNALAAAAVCHTAGIAIDQIAMALGSFEPPKRRLQLIAQSGGIFVYEDFAHHPTAIAGVIEALRSHHPGCRLICAIEPRSNTMRRGCHNEILGDILSRTDLCLMLHDSEMSWTAEELVNRHGERPCEGFQSADALVEALIDRARPGDVLVLMSNGSFGGIPAKLANHFARAREPRK